ncbi:nucleotidyltransferase domain-containing protein [Candidatus Woesearchaeota archaeon]|nr:nucleotidyltransferase domain-containing protein [Candidatus Woesearchaeota archaeon]
MDNKQKLIVFLGKNLTGSYTMHQLSLLLKIPYATFYRMLKEMHSLLIIQQVGKAKTIQLNYAHPLIKSYLAISSDEEKKEFTQINPLIKKIAAEINTKEVVVLFGSYARRKETEQSDIDLMIINKKGEKSLSFSKYELLFKKKINPLFITEKEFKLMLKEKEENVGKQVLKNHIILNNPEHFWEMVLNGI